MFYCKYSCPDRVWCCFQNEYWRIQFVFFKLFVSQLKKRCSHVDCIWCSFTNEYRYFTWSFYYFVLFFREFKGIFNLFSSVTATNLAFNLNLLIIKVFHLYYLIISQLCNWVDKGLQSSICFINEKNIQFGFGFDDF